MIRSRSDAERCCADARHDSARPAAELGDPSPGVRDQLDENAATVLRVPEPAHEPGILETVEQERHCTCAEPSHARERTGGHGPILVEQVHALDIGGIQPEHVRQGLVEGIRRREESHEHMGQLLETALAFVVAHDLP